MSYCTEDKYSCGVTTETVVSRDNTSSYTITSDRDVVLVTTFGDIPLQTRKRAYTYTDTEAFAYTSFFYVWIGDSWYPCGTGTETAFDAELEDKYITLDSKINFLDLRHDLCFVSTIEETLELNEGLEEELPENKVNVFTGYNTYGWHPFSYPNVPVVRKYTYDLYIGGVKTTLHSEEVNAAYPFPVSLLMASFPTSSFGINILTDWAKTIDWYRQDLREEEDGDRYLFFAEWHQYLAPDFDTLDEYQRNTIYNLNHSEDKSISFESGIPPLNFDVFYGSVAQDRFNNIFYSITVPETVMLTNPNYLHFNKLFVQGVDSEIPNNAGDTAWYPVTLI